MHYLEGIDVCQALCRVLHTFTAAHTSANLLLAERPVLSSGGIWAPPSANGEACTRREVHNMQKRIEDAEEALQVRGFP